MGRVLAVENSERLMERHQCPSFVLDHEECAQMGRTGDHDYDTYDGYNNPGDAIFWVPHQQEARMVQFNRLTVTIDDIISRCGYPESERERLTLLHRRLAEEFMADYQGLRNVPVPLLEKIWPSTVV